MPILNLIVFFVLVAVFSGDSAPKASGKIFAAGLATVITLVGIGRAVPTLTGFIIGYIAGAAVSFAALHFWIRMTRPQALKTTGCFIAFNLLLSILWTVFRPEAA